MASIVVTLFALLVQVIMTCLLSGIFLILPFYLLLKLLGWRVPQIWRWIAPIYSQMIIEPLRDWILGPRHVRVDNPKRSRRGRMRPKARKRHR
jgi:hypothetical protein